MYSQSNFIWEAGDDLAGDANMAGSIVVRQIIPANPSANAVVTNLVLNGTAGSQGLVALRNLRNVVIHSTSDLSASTLTITGSCLGVPVVEIITGPNNAAKSGAKFFDTITAISISTPAATNATSNIRIGKGYIGFTQPILFDNPAVFVPVTVSLQQLMNPPAVVGITILSLESLTCFAASINTLPGAIAASSTYQVLIPPPGISTPGLFSVTTGIGKYLALSVPIGAGATTYFNGKMSQPRNWNK